MNDKTKTKKYKKKCMKLTEQLIGKHTRTWTMFFETGFDDAAAGRPMQGSGDLSTDDDLDRYAKLFGMALYAKGYEAGGEAVK